MSYLGLGLNLLICSASLKYRALGSGPDVNYDIAVMLLTALLNPVKLFVSQNRFFTPFEIKAHYRLILNLACITYCTMLLLTKS